MTRSAMSISISISGNPNDTGRPHKSRLFTIPGTAGNILLEQSFRGRPHCPGPMAPLRKEEGSADLLGCLPGGRFLAVEVKAPGGRLSPEQQQFLAEVRGLGGLAVVARDWKEIDQALREAGYISDGPLFERREH